MSDVKGSPLGKASDYPEKYAPQVLYPVSRAEGRRRLGIAGSLPFGGVDLWTAFEVSWLGPRGKPRVAVGEFAVPALSPNIVESKSIKLYLNSLQQSRYGSKAEVADTIARDLGAAAGCEVAVALHELGEAPAAEPGPWEGECIDEIDVPIDCYELTPGLLVPPDPGAPQVDETLHSHLLKSNCPVTGQPDWGSVLIRYAGPRIDRAGLLRYIVSFRNTAEFHEHCAERIFVDLRERCRPARLSVCARYTRRGGLDINPFRSDFQSAPPTRRLVRQ